MARSFTREEFYDLVWSKPVTHWAKEFAISDVAIHKICKKHDVPTPPLGWWAKKAAGQAVKQTLLPETKTGFASKIVIASADFGRGAGVLADVRERARILASKGPDDDPLLSPHPIVERTLSKLRKNKPSSMGLVAVDGHGIIKCEVAVPSINRLGVALPRIVNAASIQGFELIAAEGAAIFKSETEALTFSITEAIGRKKHVLTGAEQAAEEAWQRKRDRAVRRNSWDDVYFNKPDVPEWDYAPSGQLSFEFESVYGSGDFSPRRSFRDGKTQRLEHMASDIAVGLAVLAATKTERRLEREAEQRRVEEIRLQREMAERSQYVEERRITGLTELLSEIEELDRLRRLVTMLTTAVETEPSTRILIFLDWAKEYLATRERRLSPKGIEKLFEANRLFGDDDDHDFKPSKPAWYY